MMDLYTRSLYLAPEHVPRINGTHLNQQHF